MRTKILVAFAVYVTLSLLSWSGAADLLGGHRCAGGGKCNCPMVEEMVWQDVVCHTCRLVDDKKAIKKTVYEVKEVPFCLHKLPHFGHCADCMECGCVRYKRVLIKKEITVGETCLTKCIPEEYIERQLVKVCRPACQCSIPCTGKPAIDSADVPAPVIITDAPPPPVPVPSAK